ncbi:TetR/AcrR family transcriptional regulator [Actinokineospora auranticolor]|uniref:AcrR family transcriptional regulator n=1 Tax=Actinokineospora auranticolor TaxID=155976 RepID=A0A2S6H154_9PSEU|nr:TetR/AcrR family transcriptional regulator [Actinokineospora auranticolor]PPK71146.1 AcrR family transcriptional regulator [Actinokineospora auranticolor]
MPRTTPEYAEARRVQVLDGARRCFARHGYEGTTVRVLESEIGLSSGAIFNYFPSKLDLFVALAEQDTARIARLWLSGGLRAVVETFAEVGQELSGSYLELGRRVWSDPEFREKWETRGAELAAAIDEGIAAGVREGRFRTDIPAAALADFATIVLDGFMLRIRIGGLPAHREQLYVLFEDALAALRAPVS